MNPSCHEQKTLAIIGSGISGLFVAYLVKSWGWKVDIFEKTARIGGNCHTADVQLRSTHPNGQQQENTFNRWADLGVNDFNEPMYEEVYELMQSLGVETPLLEDTASFFTEDGKIVYTLDGGYDTPMPVGLDRQFRKFKELAPSVLQDAQYKGWTLRQFLKNPTFEFSNEFIQYCIFARANAMYFADNRDVGNMPVQSVMHYYVLQEGFGTSKPVRRRYIRGGSSAWAMKLREASQANVLVGREAVRVERKNSRLNVVWRDNGSANQTGTVYDKVVFACHANDAADVLGETLNAPDFVDMKRMLRSIKYTTSRAYAHTDESVLPPRKAWRTYNVRIRPRDENPKPYSMTYVINHHQADASNFHEDYENCEMFFVSLTPHKKLVPEKILAQGEFSHNVVDFHCMQAQQDLWHEEHRIQGQANLYFTGGWTVGAGLHIECWESAKQVVRLLTETVSKSTEMTYAETPGSRRYQPEYIRRLVG